MLPGGHPLRGSHTYRGQACAGPASCPGPRPGRSGPTHVLRACVDRATRLGRSGPALPSCFAPAINPFRDRLELRVPMRYTRRYPDTTLRTLLAGRGRVLFAACWRVLLIATSPPSFRRTRHLPVRLVDRSLACLLRPPRHPGKTRLSGRPSYPTPSCPSPVAFTRPPSSPWLPPSPTAALRLVRQARPPTQQRWRAGQPLRSRAAARGGAAAGADHPWPPRRHRPLAGPPLPAVDMPFGLPLVRRGRQDQGCDPASWEGNELGTTSFKPTCCEPCAHRAAAWGPSGSTNPLASRRPGAPDPAASVSDADARRSAACGRGR